MNTREHAPETMNESYAISYLDQLEHESIHMIREAVASFEKPVMLYSIGKDSSVLLHLARKAFAPGPLPFPLMHVETGYQFTEMIAFRDKVATDYKLDMIVERNMSEEAEALTGDETHTEHYIYLKKTKPLLEGLKKHGFDAAFGGARRDEEKSRAKERAFSVRSGVGGWDPKNQRPELWSLYNGELAEGQTMRVFPLSNWTEADIWAYILRESIPVVPIYFAKKQHVLKRRDMLLRVDEFVQPREGEEVFEISARYRTLGCSPSTGIVESEADTLEKIVDEVMNAEYSERQNRAIDKTSSAAMEKKKREGYF